jgi:RNA polymerase sigma-70 factor (ECF subfamily)
VPDLENQGLGRDPSFATTRWSLVLAAGDSQRSDFHDALAALCESYWYPIYVHLRQLHHDPDTARDFTQGFFTHLLDRHALKVASPERGRFRAFLKTSLHNYLSNERHRAHAAKRGGGRRDLSLDFDDAESRYALEPVERETPETVFERSWARTILTRALEHLREEIDASDAADRLKRLEPCLLGDQGPSYRELAAELDMTEAAVKVAVHRMRRRFGMVLRAEVARTVADPAAIDAEIRQLLKTAPR